ncbi:hypothetical protein RSAG8_00321, partial [Rhizoctonia solani AG-8 WAC10335]
MLTPVDMRQNDIHHVPMHTTEDHHLHVHLIAARVVSISNLRLVFTAAYIFPT